MPELSAESLQQAVPHDRQRQRRAARARRGRRSSAAVDGASPRRRRRLCRTAGHQQFLVPARRLASRRAGGDRGGARPRARSRSPTATASPASCARTRRRRRSASGSSSACGSILRDGTSLLAYPRGPRRLWPPDPPADPRQAPRRRRANAISTTPMSSRMARGRSSSPCRRRTVPSRVRARVAADFPGRAYLAAHHLYRGDDARRLARSPARRRRSRAAARRDQRRALPHARAAAAAGRRDLHPRALHDRRGRVPPRRQCRAPSEAAAPRWRGCSAATRTRWRAPSEIAERCRFSLDELRYEYPEEPVPAGHDAAAAPRRNWPGQGAAETISAARRWQLRETDPVSFETDAARSPAG